MGPCCKEHALLSRIFEIQAKFDYVTEVTKSNISATHCFGEKRHVAITAAKETNSHATLLTRFADSRSVNCTGDT